MRIRKALIPVLILIQLVASACVYIVLPEGLDLSGKKDTNEWGAVVTGVSQTASGDLHIDLAIRNMTGDWSTMTAAEGKPAILTAKDGKAHSCDTVFVSTGGHRLAPGFQMRGYTAGTKVKPETQLLYVECKGVQTGEGAKLAIEYIAFTGEMDYYHQDDGQTTGMISLNLDEIEPDLVYPVFQEVEGLSLKPEAEIIALSDTVIRLLDVQRTDTGFEFTWENSNPTEFALKSHIGTPPVIGSDGIIYGKYEIMDLASTPLAPAKGKVEWKTTVAAPADVSGYYILLSVEAKNMRHYVNHLIDITDR